MSSESIPPAFPDKSDHGIDLENIFQHSAGLRTARFIVSSFLRASKASQEQNTATGAFSTVSLPFIDTDDSGSESAGILKELLAFKDNEEQSEGQTDFNSMTNKNVEHSGHLPATSSTDFSLHQMTSNANNRNAITPHGYTPFQAYNAQIPHNTNSSAMDLTQPRHGTDSPYRVESPFLVESNDSNSQASSRPPSNTTTFGAFRPGPDQYNIDQPMHDIDALPNYSNNNASEDTLMKDGFDTATPALRPSGRPLILKPSTTTATGRAAAKELPSIKSFLPVNKGGEGHALSARKEPPNVNSAPNRRLMPNSLSSTYNMLPKISGVSHSSNFSPLPPTDNNTQAASSSSVMEPSKSKAKGKKRRGKDEAEGAPVKKRKSIEKGEKPKRVPKVKEPKPEPARYQIGPDLWMRILEFTPPSFIRKARLLNKEFKDMVDTYQSIYLNQRIENFGEDMPRPLGNMTERQYNDLLSGKGCMEDTCSDTKASRTHWSWEKRLCQNCWKLKIEREDRLQKIWQNQLTRNIINRLLECIPVGMHDSFMKPHDFIEDVDSRPRGAPRLYRYHFKSDVEKIVEEYEALKPPPYKENPEHSAAEKASALAAHQALEAEFAEKRTEFLEQRKAKNDEHMKRVVKIETCIRNRREVEKKPYDANRNARKERFTKGAETDLPHIPIEFVQNTKAYKAAVRIFRDPGTERGWQLLKPKIEAEWDESTEKKTHEDKARNGNTDDNSTTRETSTVNEAEPTPEPLPAPEQVHHHSHHHHIHAAPNSNSFHAGGQHVLNMAASQQSDLLQSMMMMGGHNQFHSASYHTGMHQTPHGFHHSQRVHHSVMLPTATYHNEALNRNDFGMSGPVMQIPPSYVGYNAFPSGGSFTTNLQVNPSSQQASNTQIPINSLLNGPASAFNWN